MIKEFSVCAKPVDNKAKVTFVVLLVIAALDFTAYALMSHFKVQKSGLVGFVALIFIVSAVFIYTKYISPKLYYDIMLDSEGTALFVVRQTIGKRQSTLCRIALYEISRIDREDKVARKSHKTPFSHRKYSYLPSLFPIVTYRLTTKSRYEQAEILIEVSDDYAALLLEYVKEAKEIENLREANELY